MGGFVFAMSRLAGALAGFLGLALFLWIVALSWTA